MFIYGLMYPGGTVVHLVVVRNHVTLWKRRHLTGIQGCYPKGRDVQKATSDRDIVDSYTVFTMNATIIRNEFS